VGYTRLTRPSDPNAIRRALARTPTKPRFVNTSAKAGRTSVQKGSTTTARVTTSTARPRSTITIQTPTKQTPAPLQSETPIPTAFQKALDDGIVKEDEIDAVIRSGKPSAFARVIQQRIEEALKESARCQSNISTAPPTPRGQPPSPTPNRPKSPRVVILVKRGRGRPRKDQTTTSKPGVAAPRTTRSTATKRKLSIGSKSYTPKRRKRSVSFLDSEEDDIATPKTKKKPAIVEISSGESTDELAPAKKTPKKSTPAKVTPTKPNVNPREPGRPV
jgi:hypothetical protein